MATTAQRNNSVFLVDANENKVYVNGEDLTGKLTDLSDNQYSDMSDLTAIDRALGTAWTLQCSVANKGNWTVSNATAYLVGNTVRFNFTASRSSATSTGNITNEHIMTVTLTHNGKINDFFNNSFVQSSTGGVATFYTNNVSNYNSTTQFDVRISATGGAYSEFTAFAVFPVTINYSKY